MKQFFGLDLVGDGRTIKTDLKWGGLVRIDFMWLRINLRRAFAKPTTTFGFH
jgi:hypothetical protein